MLLEQNYEPLVVYDDKRLELVLNLPKKIIIDDIYIYRLRLTFIEKTYIHLAYVSCNEEMGEVLVEMKFNLNEHSEEYINQLLDFLEEHHALHTQKLEERCAIRE